MGQLQEYLEPAVLKDEDFRMNANLVEPIKTQEQEDRTHASRSRGGAHSRHFSTQNQAEQGQATALPMINQAKSENPTKVKQVVAPVGLQKPNAVKINHPLLSEKGKERPIKTKVKTGRRGAENDELYQQLHQLGQRQLQSLVQSSNLQNSSDYPGQSNADAASTKQSNQYNCTIGKAKTPVVGTKVKTSYDYSSQLVPSSNYDNRTQRVQYDLYY